MQGGDRKNRQKVKGKERGKAAIPSQGLQAAFQSKAPLLRGLLCILHTTKAFTCQIAANQS